MKKKPLKIIGIWGERLVVFPDPRQLLTSDLSLEDREIVARHIEECPDNSFPSVAPYREEENFLAGSENFEFQLKSDGIWLFPMSLAFYVRAGVLLPTEFVNQAKRSQDFHFPKVRPNEYSINEMYWLAWSVTHSSWNWYFLCFLTRLVFSFPLYFLGLVFRTIFRYEIW